MNHPGVHRKSSYAAFYFMTVGAACERYAFDAKRFGLKDLSRVVTVLEGDVKFDQLDLGGVQTVGGFSTAGWFIAGDLWVGGAIYNIGADHACPLIVCGNLHAGAVAITGQNVLVGGNALVEGICCGGGDRGRLCVGGSLSTGCLVPAPNFQVEVGDRVYGVAAGLNSGYTESCFSAQHQFVAGILPLEMALVPAVLERSQSDDEGFAFATVALMVANGEDTLRDVALRDELLATYQRGYALLQEGRSKAAGGQYEDALGCYAQARSLGYNSPTLDYAHAVAAFFHSPSRLNSQLVRYWLENAIAAGVAVEHSRRVLAWVLAMHGTHEDCTTAIALCKTVLVSVEHKGVWPVESVCTVSLALLRRGKLKVAAYALRMALNYCRTDFEFQTAYGVLARLYLHRLKLPEAVSAFERAHSHGWATKEALYVLRDSLDQLMVSTGAMTVDAREAFEVSLQLTATEVEIALGQTQDALRRIAPLARANPLDSDAWHLYAAANWEVGRPVRGILALRHAHKLMAISRFRRRMDTAMRRSATWQGRLIAKWCGKRFSAGPKFQPNTNLQDLRAGSDTTLI